MLVFNSPEYAKQRQEVKPLSLEEMESAEYSINCYVYYWEKYKGKNNLSLELIQRLIWEYENLKHSNEVKCQCCYKNTTADIDVIEIKDYDILTITDIDNISKLLNKVSNTCYNGNTIDYTVDRVLEDLKWLKENKDFENKSKGFVSNLDVNYELVTNKNEQI